MPDAFFGHAIQSPSAGSSVSISWSKRRSSSVRLVVKKTVTCAPGFAPSFADSSRSGTPLREQPCLALGREPHALRPLGRSQRVTHGLLQRTKLESRGQGARDVCVHEVLPPRVGDPPRQLHPLPDAALDQKRVVDPDDLCIASGYRAAGVEQLGEPSRLAGDVVHAAYPSLGRANEPRGGVSG